MLFPESPPRLKLDSKDQLRNTYDVFSGGVWSYREKWKSSLQITICSCQRTPQKLIFLQIKILIFFKK